MFKTSRNGPLPGKYFPYGISQSAGIQECRKIIMRQNAFLTFIQIIAIQGLKEEILDTIVEYRDENGMKVKQRAREILTSCLGVRALEKSIQLRKKENTLQFTKGTKKLR